METRVADANEIPIPEETSFISCHFKSIGVCVLLRAETGGKCNGETEIETETEGGKEGLGMGNREKQERKKGGTKKREKVSILRQKFSTTRLNTTTKPLHFLLALIFPRSSSRQTFLIPPRCNIIFSRSDRIGQRKKYETRHVVGAIAAGVLLRLNMMES